MEGGEKPMKKFLSTLILSLAVVMFVGCKKKPTEAVQSEQPAVEAQSGETAQEAGGEHPGEETEEHAGEAADK
jgi:uncharacterized protein YcfL